MSYRLDGMGRDIQATLRMAMALMAGAFQEKYKQPKFMEHAAQEMWLYRLYKMIDEGKINEAENELLDKLDREKRTETGKLNIPLLYEALDVYGYINEKEDEFLESHSYSRDEIRDGIRGVLWIGGIEMPVN